MDRLGTAKLAFLLGVFIYFNESNAKVINTPQGSLQGIEETSRNGTGFCTFYSIPYAVPPVGSLRFENESKLPVIVWFHGGAFTQGSGSFYGPKYFLDHSLVLVTCNYRLGALGFLSACDKTLPGNYGMKDQVLSLKWVKKYIKYYGGDPDQVTIFGESAGAASVHLHMYSNQSTGLFHRGISDSGTALSSWGLTPCCVARQRTITLGMLLGCNSADFKEVVQCIKTIPARTIIEATQKLNVYVNEPQIPFAPVVEPKYVEDAFLTVNPLKTEELHSVPWLHGMNSGEGRIKTVQYFSNPNITQELSNNYELLLPIIVGYRYWLNNSDVRRTTDKLLEYYLGGRNISKETENEMTTLITDTYFTCDLITSCHRHKNTTHVYLYNYPGNFSLTDFMGNCCQQSGPSHADELPYLFNLALPLPELTGTALNVSKRMVGYWSHFAQKGKPTPDDSWKESTSSEIDYLLIEGENDEMKKGLYPDRFQFCENLRALLVYHPGALRRPCKFCFEYN